ncbi:MAG: transporter substrate-binding domain-containing protein [Desulfamplus sp.]|nr:transporter substrate-binding domain-containing protein [Desulfamplus sp.]
MKTLYLEKISMRKSSSTTTILTIVSLCIISLYINSPAFAQEKIVNVATLDDYSPYCFSKNDKKSSQESIPPGSDSANLQGYSWDVLRESFHAEGYTIKLSVYPWKRAVYDTKTGIEDIVFPMIKSQEREESFYFSKESVDQVNFIVYVPLDSTIQWQGIESLNGLTVGQIRGWNLGKQWSQNDKIKKDDLTKIIQGFKMLDMGRIAGFAGYEINFDYALKNENWKTKYKKLPSFDASIEYVAGVKTNPRVPDILRAFDLGKKKIVENKTFDLISTKWGVDITIKD